MDKEKITYMDKLHDLLGYVQNGSQREIKIFQDDATNNFHIVILGSNREPIGREWGVSLEDVINKAWLKFK